MPLHELLTAPTLVALGGYEIGTGRTVPTVAAVLGLISVAVASTRRGAAGPRRGVVALVLGTIAAVVGGVHAANAAGGLGTGNGLAGAVVAVVLGLIGMLLAGLIIFRARRVPSADPGRSD